MIGSSGSVQLVFHLGSCLKGWPRKIVENNICHEILIQGLSKSGAFELAVGSI